MLFEVLFPNKSEYFLSIINGFKIMKHSENYLEFKFDGGKTDRAQVIKNVNGTFDMILFHKRNAVFVCSNASVNDMIDFLYINTDCLWGDE